MLSELELKIKTSTQKLIIFQAGIMKACKSSENQGIEELTKRIEELEKRIKENVVEAETDFTNLKIEEKQTKKVASEKADNKKNNPQKEDNKTKETGMYISYWSSVVSKLKQNGKVVLYTNLINTKAVQINDMTIGIEFQSGLTAFGRTVLEKPENMQEIIRLVSLEAGQEMQIKYLEDKKEQEELQKTADIEDVTKMLNIPVNIIEE